MQKGYAVHRCSEDDLNAALGIDVCPNFVYGLTERHVDKRGADGHKPDFISCRRTGAKDAAAAKAITDLARAELLGELEQLQCDPIIDSPQDAQHENDHCLSHEFFKTGQERTLGQMITYSACSLARQSRTFVYCLLVCGQNARILRSGHAGTIVSRVFDITTEEGPRVSVAVSSRNPCSAWS